MWRTRGGTISKITSGGVVSSFAAGLTAPSGLVFDTAHNLYVGSEVPAGVIYKITPGGVVSTFATGLSSPEGLAIDMAGNLYAADDTGTFPSTIDKITPGGVVSTFATNGFPSRLFVSCLLAHADRSWLTESGSQPSLYAFLASSVLAGAGFLARRFQKARKAV